MSSQTLAGKPAELTYTLSSVVCMHVLTNTCACCRVPDDWLPPVEDQQAVIEVKRKVGPQEHGIPEQMSTVQFCLVCFTGAYVIMDTCRVAKAAFAKNANATSRPAVTTAVFVANASSGWCASCSHSFIDNVIAACQHPRYESHAQYAIISELCSSAVCTFCRITIVHGSTIVLGMATTRRSYYFLCVSLLNTPAATMHIAKTQWEQPGMCKIILWQCRYEVPLSFTCCVAMVCPLKPICSLSSVSASADVNAAAVHALGLLIAHAAHLLGLNTEHRRQFVRSGSGSNVYSTHASAHAKPHVFWAVMQVMSGSCVEVA